MMMIALFFQLLVAVLIQVERLRGVITSGILFIFWLLMSLAGIIPFYTLIELEVPVMILSFWTDRSRQTVQTQIRLLLEERSDQGLHCLLFNLHLFDEIPLRLSFGFEF